MFISKCKQSGKMNDNVQKKVCEMFGKTEQEAKEQVENIKNFLKTQSHLPEIMDDVMIRNFLNLTKFNTEKTKEKIDTYYTIRTKIPDFFKNSNPKLPNMQRLMEKTYFCTYPHLVDEIHRVTFFKPKEPNSFQAKETCWCFFNLFQVRLLDDVMIDDIFIADMANMTFKDLITITPRLLGTCFNIYKNVFSFRMKALHFINSPAYITVLIQIMRFLMPPKLFGRVQVHKDAKFVHQMFPENEVPEDYGGSGPSLEELNENMINKFVEYQERFDKLDNMRVNESLRLK